MCYNRICVLQYCLNPSIEIYKKKQGDQSILDYLHFLIKMNYSQKRNLKQYQIKSGRRILVMKPDIRKSQEGKPKNHEIFGGGWGGGLGLKSGG